MPSDCNPKAVTFQARTASNFGRRRGDQFHFSLKLLEWLQKAIAQHGAPEYLRSDNGSEFIAKIVQRWLAENKIKTLYIEPGSP